MIMGNSQLRNVWEERKFEIEIHRKDGSILKKVSKLIEREQ
jgi:hypothetical protein